MSLNMKNILHKKHLSGHTMTATVLKDMIQETLYNAHANTSSARNDGSGINFRCYNPSYINNSM
jgi:hypothetical protein